MPPRGRAWPRALPRQREGGLPGRGVSESAGRGAPKEGRGPKGSTGEGTPRRDPGGPAGRSRPNGRVGGHQSATATAATAHSWRRGPAYWTSHSRPQAGKWGAVPGEAPGTATGETGAKPHGLLREESGRRPKGPAGPQAVESPGLRDALIPKGPPLSPPPTGGGFRRYGGPPSRRCAFVQGWRPYNQRPRTGPVRRRARSRRARGKGTPPHGRWGGVGAWGSPVQGEVRMVPPPPTATKVPFP